MTMTKELQAWRPISEPTPTDEPVLCARGSQMFIARQWEDKEWSLDLGGNDECLVLRKEEEPTHWMPLPAPPLGVTP